MSTSECFVFSTNPKYSSEFLGKHLAKQKSFDDNLAPFWIVCKSIAVSDLNKSSATIFGQQQEITPINLKQGQEALCIGYDRSFDLMGCFPTRIKKHLSVIEGWMFADMDYTQVWRDEPIEIKGKRYFAHLKTSKGENANAEASSPKPREEQDDIEAEPRSKIEDAINLPAGWVWKANEDGSGSLHSPDGRSHFSYDLMPYAAEGGIEYQRTPGTGDWRVFYGPLATFKGFAERAVCEELAQQKTSLADKITNANQQKEDNPTEHEKKTRDLPEL